MPAFADLTTTNRLIETTRPVTSICRRETQLKWRIAEVERAIHVHTFIHGSSFSKIPPFCDDSSIIDNRIPFLNYVDHLLHVLLALSFSSLALPLFVW
jgi:hypothetical protein